MNPNYVPALLEYARFQLAKKDFQMADYYFKHTLKKDPSNAEVTPIVFGIGIILVIRVNIMLYVY